MGFSSWTEKQQESRNTSGYVAKIEARQRERAEAEAERAAARSAELDRQKNVRAASRMATLNEDGHVVLPKIEARSPASSYTEQNAGVLRTGFTAPDPLGAAGANALEYIDVNKRRLEALKNSQTAADTSAYKHYEKMMEGAAEQSEKGAEIRELQGRIDRASTLFTRQAAERAAAGKTVEESRTAKLLENPMLNTARARLSVKDGIGVDVKDMTESQRHTYDYLYQNSPEMAKKYADSISTEVNARTAERENKAVTEFTKEHPVVGTALNLGASFFSGLSGLDAAVSAITGKEYDPNSLLNAPTRLVQATQQGLTEDIENPFAKFLVDTGLSTAQFLTKLPLGQTAALTVMASGAAGQTAYDVRQSGGSTDEALLLGTIAGAAEAALEKVPLDNLFASLKGLDRTGIIAKLTSKIKKPIADMIGSAFEEGGEELLTEYVNNIADQIVRGDNSEMMQYKAQLMASGMSEAEAQEKALRQYYLYNPLVSFAGGALSGGILGGVASGTHEVQAKAAERYTKMMEEAAAKAEVNAQTQTTSEEAQDEPVSAENYADSFSDVLDEDELLQAEEWAREDAEEPEPVVETSQVRAKTALDDGMLPSVDSEKLRKKAEAAKTDTAKSGIYAGAKDKDIRTAEYLSKVFGRKILFASDNYRINGKLQDGTIFINPKGQNTIGQTLTHELLHTVEGNAKQYAQVFSVLQDVSREKGINWAQRKENIFATYSAQLKAEGRQFTDIDATYETAAAILSEMITDTEQLEALARRNRNVVVHFWSKVKAIASRVTGQYKYTVDKDGKKTVMSREQLETAMYLRRVEDAFGKALAATKKQAKSAAKYSLSPKEAASKQQAVQMIQAGISAQQVQDQTGWYLDDKGVLRNDEIAEPDLSTPMKRRAYQSIRDTVKDLTELITTDNHTNTFKRSVTDRLMKWYDQMTLVRDEREYQTRNAEFIQNANALAEEIVDNNLIKNEDNEDTASEIKAILRRPIKVAESAKRDFHGRWNSWRKNQMGKLLLTNEKGTASDVVYMELSEAYPEYFPADIDNPGDQLRKMAEIYALISDETFIYDSYYDFEDGENQAEIDRQNIANMIVRGWEEINRMPRTEEDMLRDELELAKRMNKEEYEKRLEGYQKQVRRAYDTQSAEIRRINEEAKNKVKESRERYEAAADEVREHYHEKVKESRERYEAAAYEVRERYKQKEEKRRTKEEEARLEMERRKHRRGGDISLEAIRKSIADNTFVQKMQGVYNLKKRIDEEVSLLQKEYDNESEKYADEEVEDIQNAELKKNLKKAKERAADIEQFQKRVGQMLYNGKREDAMKFLRSGDIEKWKDKKMGIRYAINTMTRNIRDISSGDALGEEMIKRYFEPISGHVAQANRLKNNLRNRVAVLDLKTTRNSGDHLSESAFVQLMGEARDNVTMLQSNRGYTNTYKKAKMRNGRTLAEWQDVINNLMVENPGISQNAQTMEKIDHAIEEFKSIYDGLIESINNTRLLHGYPPIDYRHGYFPHFSSDVAPDGLFVELLKGISGMPDTEDLPTTINGLTRRFRPGMQYQSFANKRGDQPGESYDGLRLEGMGAVEGFDRYVETAANVIFLTDDIQNLRALSDAIRYNASRKEIKKQVDEVRANDSMDDDTKRIKIDSIYANAPTALSNFVVELEEYTNLLAGKKSMRDRDIEQYMGRWMYNFGKKIESLIAANMVALNPGSWLTNLVPLTQAAAVLKAGSINNAMLQTLKSAKESDGFIARSDFLTNRIGSARIAKTTAQKVSDTFAKPMEWIDEFVSQTIVRARYSENVASGMSEADAMQEADHFAAGIMGDRSLGQAPTLFGQQNPVTKLFTQYQLEVVNQLMWMTKDLKMYADDRKKYAALLVRYFLWSFLYNFVYKAMVGREAAFDPLGILNDTVGDLSGYSLPELMEIIDYAFSDKTISEKLMWKNIQEMFKTEQSKPSEALGNLATALAENVPFTGIASVLIEDFDPGRLPVASAIPNIKNLAGLLDPGKSAKSKAYTAYKELSKPAAYLLPPFGGGQIKKTLEGAAAIAQGGSYVPDAQGRAQLQYPVSRTNPLDLAGALVFGKSTTQGGRKWVESGFPTLSAKKTAAYQNALDAGATQKEAYNAVTNIKGTTAAEKRASLDDMQLDGNVKASLYYDTLASDKERAVMDALGSSEAVYKLMSNIKESGTSAAKTQVLASAKGLNENQRELAFNGLITDAYETRIERVRATGAGFDDFLAVYQVFSNSTGNQKKLDTLDAIDELQLTDEQKDALYLCFYTESNLHNAPWNTSMPAFQIPEVSLPEIKLPEINIPKINLPY